MHKNTLYLICPDCHIESAIRSEYGSDAYFLTALGAVFDLQNLEYAEEINQFITDGKVKHIIVVNDSDCTFIRNTVTKEENHGTAAENLLLTLQENNPEHFEHLNSEEQQQQLAKLNIQHQMDQLLEIPIIGNKIKNGQLDIGGLLYSREQASFTELEISSSHIR